MPVPERREAPQPLRAPGSSLEVFRGTYLKQLRVNQDPALENSADLLENRCCSNPCFLRDVILNLNQRIEGMNGAYRFIEQISGGRISVTIRNHRPRGAPQASQRTKSIVYGRGFITAVHHAVRTLGITRLRAIVLPLRGCQKLGKGVSVAILEQVAGLLPAKHVEGGHAPGRASIVALAHQKF